MLTAQEGNSASAASRIIFTLRVPPRIIGKSPSFPAASVPARSFSPVVR